MIADCDVVVVGAGLAGLAAATALSRRGLRPVVLEARDRVGGRTLNQPIYGGHVVEVGGQWVGPTQTRILSLIDELGLDRHATFDEGFKLAEFGGKLRRYRGRVPRLGPAVLADMAQAQFRLDRMAEQVPTDGPWLARNARRWDGRTLESWLRRNLATPSGRRACELVCQAVFAAEPTDISLLHFLFYVHSAGGLDRLISTDDGAQKWRVVGGSQLIAQRLADTLDADIQLNAPVRTIRTDAEGVVVCSETVEVRGRAVIVAVPPTLSGRIGYAPPLPGNRDQFTQRFAQGSVIKCMAVYRTPFWRAEGLSGQAISEFGPVKIVYDNSPADGSCGVLLGFLEGNHARRLGVATPERRRAQVVDCFVRLFGPQADDVTLFVEQDWTQEEWTRGCYGGFLPPGAWTSYEDAGRRPIGRIHWAGAESATTWNGYMDGAVTSGERAATETAHSLTA